MLTLSHCTGVLFVVYGLCAAQPPAAGEKQDKRVKVTMLVILASEGEKEVDFPLQKVAGEIRKKQPKLTRFKLKSQMNRSLAVDENALFALVDKETARVIVKKGADEKNRVELAIKAPGQLGFVYQTVCGKFLPIITTYRTKNGERLILAVRVKPCHE